MIAINLIAKRLCRVLKHRIPITVKRCPHCMATVIDPTTDRLMPWENGMIIDETGTTYFRGMKKAA